MSSHLNPRAQRDTLEQILNEVPGATPAEAEALLALFAVAAPPAASGELPGEAAAVAAFRVAHHSRPIPAGTTWVKRPLARLLTVKVAAAAVVVTSMGGVALAASTGVLPTPLTPHKAEQAQKKADQDATKAAAAAARDAAKAAAKAAAAADLADSDAGLDPSTSFAGLCAAYAASDNSLTGKALQAPAFIRLISAAGEAGVPAFCAELPGAQADAKAAAAATHAKAATPAGKAAEGKARADAAKADAKVKADAAKAKAAAAKARADAHKAAAEARATEARSAHAN
jgi:hypothetical protein